MERFKLIPAVHLFLIKDNRILLLRRYNTGYEDGNYSVPAGHLDGNETVRLATVREAKEEASITIDAEDLNVVHVMHRNSKDTGGERVDFFLVCTKWEGTVAIGEPNKCDELSWFPLENIPDNTIPYIRASIDDYRRSIFYSEFGW